MLNTKKIHGPLGVNQTDCPKANVLDCHFSFLPTFLIWKVRNNCPIDETRTV